MNVKPILPSPLAAGSSDGAVAARTQAMEKAEREFHAMLLREMLKPLTQALFGNANGLSTDSPQPLGSAGNETYAYFLEQALSQQLSQAWPLPDLFGTEASAIVPNPPGAIGSSPMPISLERTRLPISLDRNSGPIPLDEPRLPASVDRNSPPSIPLEGTRLPPSLDRSGPPPLAALNRRATSLDASHVPDQLSSSTPVSRGGGALPSSEHAESRSIQPDEVLPVPIEQAVETQPIMRALPGRVELPETEIRRASRLFDLPENLVRAVVLTESGGRADAVSPKGAIGYMQVLPSTGQEMGASNVRDPWQNLYAGAKYLRKQLDRFGNLEHALAAYNAGPGAVERHGGIPPYRETQNYVKRVLSRMDRLDRSGS